MSAMTGNKQKPKTLPHAEWLAARKELLAKEKEFSRQRDEISRLRRALPWEKVEKQYFFDAPGGRQSLAGLFGSHSQLLIYHFMFGPGWKEGCPSCSFISDTIEGTNMHIGARDVSLVVVSRATLPEIQKFKDRMGWHFKWVSSFGSDFNFDYNVSFSKEEVEKGEVYYNYQVTKFPAEEGPGASVFFKNETGEIFHTYSTYARGLDILVGTYNYLDLVPKGRDEEGLAHTMAWVRHHDRYDRDYKVDPATPYVAPEGAMNSCCEHEKEESK